MNSPKPTVSCFARPALYSNALVRLVIFGLAIVAHNAKGAPGDLVPEFGMGGVVFLDARSSAYAVAIQADGKIVVGGSRFGTSPVAQNEFALMRFYADGSPDRGFGNAGVAATQLGNDSVILALALLPGGGILAAGVARVDRGYDFALVKYQSDGTLDATFGSGGSVVTHLGSANDASHYLVSLAMTPDGRIVVAGDNRENGHQVFAILRYLADGRLDPQFGSGGVVTTALPTSASTGDASATSVAVQGDGKIVAGGRSTDLIGRAVFTVVRLNADGTLDANFGTGGKAFTPVGTGHANLNALTLQPDGRIVAVGEIPGGNANTTVLVRYNSDGSLDSSFGEAGVVLTNRDPPDVSSITLDNIGNIVIGGSGRKDGLQTFALLRYHGNGAIDANFGVGGVSDIPVGTSDSRANAVAIRSDGGIVAVGRANGSSDGAMVLVDGRYDTGLPYVVEYRNWLFDHYFVTLDAQQIHDLDTGVHPNWFRTGDGFRAYTTPANSASPVCRYYIPPARGDSHFFSASAYECTVARTLFPDFVLESLNAFFIFLPDTTTGACAQGLIPVYRLWNARPDSNHRYTTSRKTRDDMVSRGYVAEGYGPDLVVMCAPQ